MIQFSCLPPPLQASRQWGQVLVGDGLTMRHCFGCDGLSVEHIFKSDVLSVGPILESGGLKVARRGGGKQEN